MRKIAILGIAAATISLSACTQDTGASAEPNVLSQGLVDKSPRLPTTFVDTTGGTYPWATMYNPVQSIQNRIALPEGYQRMALPKGSFGEWLRGLPLKPGKPKVMLYNGQEKTNQEAQFAVMDIDVGKRDLQQCADAVMRLRGEYLFSTDQFDAIHFNFTNGEPCTWNKWREGYRPSFAGNKTTWTKKAQPSDSHESFRAYMDMVFMYAGTASLEKELPRIGTLKELQIGDVLIQGGFPGHAVLVVDVAENSDTGKKMYMLAQSYMPAQDIHILQNPNDPKLSPWYDASAVGPVETPEWTFLQQDLRRFK
ncbi:MAG: DUF4846 domain-containing protein [Bacteroidia bacterium]